FGIAVVLGDGVDDFLGRGGEHPIGSALGQLLASAAPPDVALRVAGFSADALESLLSAEGEDRGHALPFRMGGLEILDHLLSQFAVSSGVDGEGDGATLASAVRAVAAITSAAVIEAAGGQGQGGAGECGALQVRASIEDQFLSFEGVSVLVRAVGAEVGAAARSGALPGPGGSADSRAVSCGAASVGGASHGWLPSSCGRKIQGALRRWAIAPLTRACSPNSANRIATGEGLPASTRSASAERDDGPR